MDTPSTRVVKRLVIPVLPSTTPGRVRSYRVGKTETRIPVRNCQGTLSSVTDSNRWSRGAETRTYRTEVDPHRSTPQTEDRAKEGQGSPTATCRW